MAMKRMLLCLVCTVLIRPELEAAEISNGLLKLSFDKSSRTWSLSESVSNQWIPVISNATISLTFPGDSLNFISERGEVVVKTGTTSGLLGRAATLNVRLSGQNAQWTLSFTLPHVKKMLLLSAEIRNV